MANDLFINRKSFEGWLRAFSKAIKIKDWVFSLLILLFYQRGKVESTENLRVTHSKIKKIIKLNGPILMQKYLYFELSLGGQQFLQNFPGYL